MLLLSQQQIKNTYTGSGAGDSIVTSIHLLNLAHNFSRGWGPWNVFSPLNLSLTKALASL